MAVIKTGPIVSDIRGKAGGMVYSRGQGGAVVYAVPVPNDPNSADQQAVRATIIALSAAWSGTLTEPQRNGWRSYAAQHPLPNAWGLYTFRSGYCYFIRVNAYWHRDAEAINWTSAPDIPPLHPPAHTLTIVAATDVATIALPPSNYAPPPAGLILWHFAGYPVSAGRNYFRTPFRYTEKNTNVPGWTESPWLVSWPWDVAVGQKVFSKLIAQDLASGALSTPHQTSVIAS